MSFMIDSELVALAFGGGSTVQDGESLDFRTEDAGILHLATGRIAACDPLVCPNPRPFTRRVPPGDCPVDLAVAVLGGEDERIASARIRFSGSPTVAWVALMDDTYRDTRSRANFTPRDRRPPNVVAFSSGSPIPESSGRTSSQTAIGVSFWSRPRESPSGGGNCGSPKEESMPKTSLRLSPC